MKTLLDVWGPHRCARWGMAVLLLGALALLALALTDVGFLAP